MFNNTISRNDYNKVFSSKIHNEELSHQEKVYYITISSNSRDTVAYPSVSSYSTKLNQPLKNVKSIELIKCILPDKNQVTRQPFLVLSIDEIQDVSVSNDKLYQDSLHIISLSQPTLDNYFININTADNRIVKTYQTPLSYLSKLTINILTHDNVLFDFGGTSNDYQNLFVFKVVCIEKDFNKLNSNII